MQSNLKIEITFWKYQILQNIHQLQVALAGNNLLELLILQPQNLQPEVDLNVPFPLKGQEVPEIWQLFFRFRNVNKPAKDLMPLIYIGDVHVLLYDK